MYICRFSDIVVLQTFDGEGNISNYVGSATINRDPQFLGPGLLSLHTTGTVLSWCKHHTYTTEYRGEKLVGYILELCTTVHCKRLHMLCCLTSTVQKTVSCMVKLKCWAI